MPASTGSTASLRSACSPPGLCAPVAGDANPAHLDRDCAATDRFHGVIAHGLWGGSLISTLLGTALPGPDTIDLGQPLRFRHPARIGDAVTARATARETDPARGRLVLDCIGLNAQGEMVITGEAEVRAPTEKVRRPRSSAESRPARVERTLEPPDRGGAPLRAGAGCHRPSLRRGGGVDGPLAFDNAISRAAAAKASVLPVAGEADILVVPDLVSDNMLAKQPIPLAGADAAGIRLGARVPIILTSRAGSPQVRLASCPRAQLFAHRARTPR